MKLKFFFIFFLLFSLSFAMSKSWAEEDIPDEEGIFDDQHMLNGYEEKYKDENQEKLLAMIQDDTLIPFKTAAAVRVFKNNFCQVIFNRDKILAERTLLRRLARTDSPFIQVEIMHTLCKMDRYRYFDSMVPDLILKLDHYNDAVNMIAFDAINDLLASGNNRAQEARIVFNTLRRVLFLSRRHLAMISEPDARLTQKFQILRWAMKVLGTQEIRKLPKEVIDLL
jgi:hypothetical protein